MPSRPYLARRVREEIFASLGSFCVACGATERLTFDCKEPCGDKHHRMNSQDRAYFYRRQHQLGNVQVLCEDCNVSKGSMPQSVWESMLLGNPF